MTLYLSIYSSHESSLANPLPLNYLDFPPSLFYPIPLPLYFSSMGDTTLCAFWPSWSLDCINVVDCCDVVLSYLICLLCSFLCALPSTTYHSTCTSSMFDLSFEYETWTSPEFSYHLIFHWWFWKKYYRFSPNLSTWDSYFYLGPCFLVAFLVVESFTSIAVAWFSKCTPLILLFSVVPCLVCNPI